MNTRAAQHVALEQIETPGKELSQSVYDIAVVSLLPGPQSEWCVQWLIDHQNDNGTWGSSPQLCWYDSYMCTYAAAVALRSAGLEDRARQTFDKLAEIGALNIAHTPETLTFGGLIDTLDRYCQINGWPAFTHNATTQRIIHEERAKWQKMLQWDGFYDPMLSIAGYSGERVYGDERVDLKRFIDAFQSINGSISNSAGASAMALMEAARRNTSMSVNRLAHLREYVYSLNPYRQSIGYLDFASHFVTAWAIMYLSELGHPTDALRIIQHKINEMYDHLHDGAGLRLLCPVGLTTIPGDTDSTACAIWAAVYAGKSIPDISRLDTMYVANKGYYQTFLYERDPSISTNIHIAALLAQYNPARLDAVLGWLAEQVAQSKELICKWHVSPSYTIGELARVLAHIDHAMSQLLFLHATRCLLDTQRSDGGWGTGGSTIEETGYAVLGLTAVYDRLARVDTLNGEYSLLRGIYEALLRAHHYLYETPISYPPLWIGKSLYCVEPLVPVLCEISKERIKQIVKLGGALHVRV